MTNQNSNSAPGSRASFFDNLQIISSTLWTTEETETVHPSTPTLPPTPSAYRQWLAPIPHSHCPYGAYQKPTLRQQTIGRRGNYRFRKLRARARRCRSPLWQVWNMSDRPDDNAPETNLVQDKGKGREVCNEEYGEEEERATSEDSNDECFSGEDELSPPPDPSSSSGSDTLASPSSSKEPGNYPVAEQRKLHDYLLNDNEARAIYEQWENSPSSSKEPGNYPVAEQRKLHDYLLNDKEAKAIYEQWENSPSSSKEPGNYPVAEQRKLHDYLLNDEEAKAIYEQWENYEHLGSELEFENGSGIGSEFWKDVSGCGAGDDEDDGDNDDNEDKDKEGLMRV